MKDKEQIVDNWLPRYTGVPLDQFGEHILLTNFGGYLHTFARLTGAQVIGLDRPMPSATADGITMINFGMGSPNAATMMDLLSAIMPKAVLFLGKCAGSSARTCSATSCCRSPRSAAKARPTITCCPKSPPCPPSRCSARGRAGAAH